MVQHFLSKAGLMAARRVKESDMEKLARATGGRIVSDLDDLKKADLGLAGHVEERKIGDDKMKVITAYENNLLNIWPEYEDEDYTRRSKTRSVILASSDDSNNTLIFYLNNKKVVAFEVTYYEGE
jgi:chaperonin GroEL (HSP60 family)